MKTIREKTKKAILFAISTVAALSLGGGVGAITASAANDTTKLESLTTGGASVRVKGEAGIRFQSTMDDTDYQDLTAENSGFETGVIAIPADLLDNLNDLKLDNPNVANGVTTGDWSDREDGAAGKEAYAYFTALEMTEENYTRNIAFRSYYTINGATEYGNVLTRSLTYVANAAANDTTDEGKAKYEENKTTIDSYIKDYTVKYVNGVTEEVIDYKGVTESEPTAEEAALFGGEFKAWTTLGAAWDETAKTSITGDTVVKSNYTASETLDFTQATEVPTHIAVNKNNVGLDKEMKLEEYNGSIALYGSKYKNDTFTLSFLEEMTLEKGDKVLIELDATQDVWIQINLVSTNGNSTKIFDSSTELRANNSFSDYIRTRDFCGIYYEAPEGGLSFQTVEFAHTQAAIPVDYYVKSVKIEKASNLTGFDYYNIDFTQMDSIPSGFVTSTSYLKIALDEEKGFWLGERRANFKFTFPNIELVAGDTITLTLTSPMGGGNLRLNTSTTWTSKGYVNKSDGSYTDAIYTVGESGFTLSDITFLSYNENGGCEYYVKSIKITKANIALSSSVDFTTMDKNEATYKYGGAFSCTYGGSSVGFATDMIDGKEVTVLKATGTNKNASALIAACNIVFKEGTTVTVKIKIIKNGDTTTGQRGGIYLNDTTDWRADMKHTDEWQTLTFIGKATDDITIEKMYFHGYDQKINYDIYIASITIS